MHIYLFYRSCFTAALNASCFTTQCPCSYSTFEHCSFSPQSLTTQCQFKTNLLYFRV